MIVNKYISEEIDPSLFPNAPAPNSNIIKRFIADGIKLALEQNPSCIGLSPIVDVPFALVALNEDDEYIYSVSIEKIDLRILSSLIGVSVKQLQEEEGVKGFFTSPHIVMYGDGKREDLGVFPGTISIDTIADSLMEYALDSLDLIEDPVEVSSWER